MTTTLNATANGRQRKTLSYQLDRLDEILDGLADALNGAVARAVQQAVTVAVREATEAMVQEFARRPEVVRAVLATVAPPSPSPATEASPKPTWRSQLRNVGQWLAGRVRAAHTTVSTTLRPAGMAIGKAMTPVCQSMVGALGAIRNWLVRPAVRLVTGLAAAMLVAWRLRTHVPTTAVTGLSAAVVSFLLGPILTALACGLMGAALVLTGAAISWPERPDLAGVSGDS